MKVRIVFFIVCIFVSLCASAQGGKYNLVQLAQQNPALAVSKLYVDGVIRAASGDINGAKALFEKILTINVDHTPALYQLSRWNQESDPKLALELINRAMAIDSAVLEYRQLKGRVLLYNNDMSQAKAIYDQLMIDRPEEPGNFYVAALLAAELGNADEALELTNRYLVRWGYNENMVALKCDILTRQRRMDEAESFLVSTIADYPLEAPLRVSLAEVQATLRKDSLALENYRAAIELDSADYRNHLALSEYYRLKGDKVRYLSALVPVFGSESLGIEGKIEYFEQTFFNSSILVGNVAQVDEIASRFFFSDPGNVRVRELYTRYLMFVGKLDQAVTILQGDINADQATEKTFRALIDIEMYRNSNDSVMMYVNQAVRAYPRDADFVMLRGVQQWRQKKNREALSDLTRAFKLASQDSIRSVVLAITGDILYEQGRGSKAFASYDQALKYNANNVGVLNNYAYYLSLLDRDLDKAESMARRACTIEENNPTYLDTHAWVLYKMGSYTEAQNLMRRALALDNNRSSELLLHYGDILFALRNEMLAQTYWRKALDAGADKATIEERLKWQLK